MQGVASHNAPSPAVVVPHFIFGGLALLVITLLIVVEPSIFTQQFINPKLLAVTHLTVLGWVTMIIFGALYQLIPVIMEVKLYSEKLAKISFILLALGAICLSYSFWNFDIGTEMFFSAVFIIIAVVLFVINVTATSIKSTKASIERTFIVTAVAWLLFTVFAGLTLVINLAHPFLKPTQVTLIKLHAHAGIIGWFFQLIIGVSSRLLPMFMVSHNLNKKKLTATYYLLNLGLLIGVFSLYNNWQIGVNIAIVSVVLGILFYLSYLFEAYKKRIRKHLDIGMKQSVLSFLIILIPLLLILLLVFGFNSLKNLTQPIIIAYGSTIVLGFITSLILGQTYKTLPFIIWLKVYRKRVGKGKIPLPKELYSEKIATIQLWSFSVGFIILLAGIVVQSTNLVRLGGVILVLTVLLYNYNSLKIILHKPIKINE